MTSTNAATINTFTLNPGSNSFAGPALNLAGANLRFDLGSSSSDRLQVNAGTAAVSGTNNIRLLLAQSGGTASSDRINNAATVNLAGGTFDLGGRSEGAFGTAGIGALTLSANSTIDFGASTNESNIIQFAGVGAHTAGTILAIIDWNGTPGSGGGPERLLFSGNTTDFTAKYAPDEVSFNGVAGYTAIQFGSTFEIAPIPEPSTWFAAAALLGLVGYRERRRVRAFCAAACAPEIGAPIGVWRPLRLSLGPQTSASRGCFNTRR